MRKAKHLHPVTKEPIDCLDIANVNATIQGKGAFKSWLKEVIDVANVSDFDAVYVENVLTDQFANFFRRQGWIETSHSVPCFFFLLKRPTINEFNSRFCTGRRYDSCVSSPCLHSSSTGCTHPMFPLNQK